jgi:hypothetical protein
MSRAAIALILAVLVCRAVSFADAPAAVELPAKIRAGLESGAQSLSAGQTIEWDVVRSSPISIAAGKKIIGGGKSPEVQQALRGTTHVSFTRQADLRFFEHSVDEGDKLPSGKPSRTDDIEYSFDGITRFTHLANSGEAHGLVWATQEELRNIDLDSVFLLDETYFRCFGVSMSTTPKSIDKKLPPTSVILNLLLYGAQLSAVDHVTSGQKNLVRLKIDATDKLSPSDTSWMIDIFPLMTPP